MVAVDTEHPHDERHAPLQRATGQMLSLSQEYRLICVSVVSAPPLGGSDPAESTTGKHLEHKARLRQWVEPLKLPPGRISLHVVESANAADTLLELERSNPVDLIVLGAPGPSQRALAWWRSVASSVTANALQHACGPRARARRAAVVSSDEIARGCQAGGGAVLANAGRASSRSAYAARFGYFSRQSVSGKRNAT